GEVARSLFGAALEASAAHIGSLRAANALVIGAGAMSGLVVSGLHREGVSRITVQAGHDERSEEHTSELQSRFDLVCRLLLEKKKKNKNDSKTKSTTRTTHTS